MTYREWAAAHVLAALVVGEDECPGKRFAGIAVDLTDELIAELDKEAAMSDRISEPGVYSLPDDAYHADPCPGPSLSSSVAKLMLDRSPLHAWHAHPRLNPNFEPRAGIEYLGSRLGGPSGTAGKLMGRGRDL